MAVSAGFVFLLGQTEPYWQPATLLCSTAGNAEADGEGPVDRRVLVTVGCAQYTASQFQLPPCSTRYEPSEGPAGSDLGECL